MIRISAVARILGAHPDTIRAMETRGLFQAQRDHAGHRRYSADDIARLRALLYPPRPAGAPADRTPHARETAA